MFLPFVAPHDRKISDTTQGSNRLCCFIVLDISYLVAFSLVPQAHAVGLGQWGKWGDLITPCPVPSRVGQGAMCVLLSEMDQLCCDTLWHS